MATNPDQCGSTVATNPDQCGSTVATHPDQCGSSTLPQSPSEGVCVSSHSQTLEKRDSGDLQSDPSVGQCVGQSGSSLVFLPRGLSSLSRATTPDLAPDLEMDLYGISYSLDESQDHLS